MLANKSEFFGKYRAVVAAIAIFLVLGVGGLTLNFYLSARLEQDAVGVNLAGRQRMLSQRITKSLLAIEGADSQGREAAEAYDELQGSMQLFGSTLKAFCDGGMVTGAGGDPVFLAAATSDRSIAILEAAKHIWLPMMAQIQAVLEQRGATPNPQLAVAVANARLQNTPLLKYMNDLTIDLETLSRGKAQRLQIMQVSGVLLALFSFCVLVFHFIRRLQHTDEEIGRYQEGLEAAKRQTDDILSSVQEGLFLIDRDGSIQTQHSAALGEIFEEQQFAGRNFVEMLTPMVPEKVANTVKAYLGILFDRRIKRSTLRRLNPLDQIEVYMRRVDGDFVTKFLEFGFQRVKDGQEIQRVVASVTDVTQRVRLARQLKASEEKAQHQIEILFNILHIDPVLLRTFVENADRKLSYINNRLKEGADEGGGFRQLLDDIYAAAHGVKGEASMIQVGIFEDMLHDFESDIAALRDQGKTVSGDDLLPLTLKLEMLVERVVSVKDLLGRIANLRRSLSDEVAVSASETDQMLEMVQGMARRLGEAEGKEVAVVAEDFDLEKIPQGHRGAVRDIVVQLVRNSVCHGIETRAERHAASKSESGVIELSLAPSDNGALHLRLRDDGRGIQLERIRQRLEALGEVPRGGDWTPGELVAKIFDAGLSTADGISVAGGRGIGMNLVKQKVQEIGGGIRVSFAPGRYSEFQVALPAA